MAQLFAVIRSRAAAWDWSQPLEGQRHWRAHADFMNALVAEGFVLLGGPLEDTGEALLIVRAESTDAIRRRLDADPWSDGHLRTARVTPWTLRLGALG